MLDINTIPPVVIQEGTYGEVEIIKDGYRYFLKHSGVAWNQYNTKNMREYHEQWSGYDMAYGDVLISGFGFGQFATWLAAKPEVTSVTVLEVSQDIVNAFLANNIMPSKVEVIICDANQYKTDKHYDCIILDHISDGLKSNEFIAELANLSNNIPNHNLFWFWSLEGHYLMNMYGITWEQLYLNPIDFKLFNFFDNWEKFRSLLKVSTLPQLTKEKLDSYIDSYFLRHLIQ